MKITVEGSTKPGFKADKKDFEIFSGKAAGICYMKENFEALKNEEESKTLKRADGTKFSGHHSVFDHDYINLYLEDIPKALAMVLNNEKMYTTSEKSARYTRMVMTEKERTLYEKWLGIFEKLISEKYKDKYKDFFTDLRIKKLAQENARYLTSVFTPTSMMYTVSYRQLNYLYGFMKNEIERETHHPFYEKLLDYMYDFCIELEKTGFIDHTLVRNNKGRSLSLINTYKPVETFGDVYATTYEASLAELAEAQRHRTLNYTIDYTQEPKFFVPPIISKDKDLSSMWLEDIGSLKDNVPQGMLVSVSEMGTMDNFILKMMERKCSFALLEINMQTNDTLKKYVKALKEQNHPRADELELYTRGSRCTFKEFKCTSPCGFKEGINETRII